MSKAENYIREQTKRCSEGIRPFEEWLTPNQAREAVKIAREETYDKIWHWLAEHINDYVVEGKGRDIDLMFDDIKQAIK